MQELRTIADENDIMLIYDEVQTGIGVTGKNVGTPTFSQHTHVVTVVAEKILLQDLISSHLVKKHKCAVLQLEKELKKSKSMF